MSIKITPDVLPADAATETTSAALLTELQLKADLTETQPVSAASLPLPSGAATETTSAALLTELQLKADLTETQPVSAASLPLPSGAATETTSAALLTELQLKADLTETQPVSAASLPLPSGAATEATLAAIDTDTGNIAIDTAVIAGDTTSLDAKVPPQGAAVIAASLPVNIASNQTVPVSAASLPLPSGAATAANQLADGHNVTVDNTSGSPVPVSSYIPGLTTRVEFVVDTSPAYSTLDQVGAVVTIANAARVSGSGGRIETITVLNQGAFQLDVLLYFFSASPASANDNNNALVLTAADTELLLGSVSFGKGMFQTMGAGGWAATRPVNIRYQCAATSLFMVGQALTAFITFGATDNLQVILGLRPD